MKIWKQHLGELTEISPDVLSEDVLREIREALPDDEGDYAPYINAAQRIIAVTDRALKESDCLLYTPTGDGECALEGSGLSTLDHIVVPAHTPTGEVCTEVAENAFLYESSVKSVTFLGSVTIRDMAFCGCDGLEQVTVCGVLAELSEQAFDDCTALTRFNAWDAMVMLGDSAFRGCVALERFSAHRVCALGREAFSGCESLTHFDSALEIDEIPTGAFEGCKHLSAIRIPEGVRMIGWRAFEGCESLTILHLPDGLTVIDDSAFYGCSALAEMVVPYSVDTIGDMAFCCCTGLTHLRVPHGVARDTLLDDEDIRRFTDFYTLYDPHGWESYNVASDTQWIAGVEFYKLDS
jgi:hypothetical protein